MTPEIFLIINIKVLQQALEERLETIDFPEELQRQDMHMLVLLTEPKRMGELAEEMQVLPSTMTAVVDRMERLGMILRKRDPRDRRAWLVELTAKGHEVRDDAFAEGTAIFRSVTGLSQSEITAFHKLMTKVRSHVIAHGFPEELKT